MMPPTQMHMYIVGVQAESRAEADNILRQKMESQPKAPVFYASGGGDFTVLVVEGLHEVRTDGGQ